MMILMLSVMTLTAHGQDRRDSINRSNDWIYYGQETYRREKSIPQEVKDVHLWKAGVYERNSATFEACAWAAGIASGVAFSGTVIKNRDMCNIAGIGLGVVAAVCFGCSLDFRLKSGAELKLSATGLALTF